MDVVSLHQAGITYAVATLGTATTPEHLQRIFRLVGEVVFCFDGDRAGRAAAWRALENAMGEIKQGRQVRFLFLPDGHDPDTLVREKVPPAFEARLASATPLSDYLIDELSSRVDMTASTASARLVELARPLIREIPSDVYRELLVTQLAEVGAHVAVGSASYWRPSAATGRRRPAQRRRPVGHPRRSPGRVHRRRWPAGARRTGSVGPRQPGPPGRHAAGAFPEAARAVAAKNSRPWPTSTGPASRC